MIIKRQRSFSKSGKFWAGTKGTVKGAGKGALLGAAFMPGWKLAAIAHHPKLAAGIAATGAAIGAVVGGRLGYEDGIHGYEYSNNPEYRKKVDKEHSKLIEKAIKNALAEDKMLVSEFTPQGWTELKKKISVPDEFIRYVKFYKNIWSKKIDSWYSNIKEGLDPYEIPEFKSLFPIPIDPKTAEEWFSDDVWLCLATYNSAGDDGWLCYDPKTKRYGVDMPDSNKSLKEILLDVSDFYELTGPQEKMVEEFKNRIKTL